MTSLAPPRISAGVGNDFDRAQSFTVGRAGVLARVDLYLARGLDSSTPNNVEISIRRLVGGVPDPVDGNALATKILSSSTFPDEGWIYAEFNVAVNVGDVLAIVARKVAGSGYPILIGNPDSNAYVPGQNFYRDLMAGGVFLSTNGDWGFRTYVR
jgi:hypothetical protein